TADRRYERAARRRERRSDQPAHAAGTTAHTSIAIVCPVHDEDAPDHATSIDVSVLRLPAHVHEQLRGWCQRATSGTVGPVPVSGFMRRLSIPTSDAESPAHRVASVEL